MTFKVILNFFKNLCPHIVYILEKFKKDCALSEKYITEEGDFEILR